MDVLTALLIFLSAALGDTFGSLFGGGSFFVQPALILAGVQPHLAVANDVASAGFSSLFFVWSLRKQGQVNWRVVGVMAPACVLGAIAGVQILKSIPAVTLQWFLVGVCSLGILNMILKLVRSATAATSSSSGAQTFVFGPLWMLAAVIAGFLIGVYDGVSGAGSGVLIIVVLSLIFKAQFKALVATASAISLVSVLSAGATSLVSGLLDPVLMLILVPAAALSGVFAGRILTYVPDRTLRICFVGAASLILGLLLRQML